MPSIMMAIQTVIASYSAIRRIDITENVDAYKYMATRKNLGHQ